jgi:GntR family transcriptional regulator
MPSNPSRLEASAPRYQHVAAALQQSIAQGRYPVGSLLPPEPQLCEAFGVSRHTIREAVRILCGLGLLVRRQGVGTTVQAAAPAQRFVATLNSLGDLMQYTQETRLRSLGHRWVQPGPPLSGWLDGPPGERWLELDTCRYPIDGSVPIVHMKVYVRPECEAIREDLEDGSAWIYGLIEKHGGEPIVRATQSVSAVPIDKDSARVVQVRAGSPGMQVRRQYWGERRLLSLSVNTYPYDRFEFVTTWRLKDGGEGGG